MVIPCITKPMIRTRADAAVGLTSRRAASTIDLVAPWICGQERPVLAEPPQPGSGPFPSACQLGPRNRCVRDRGPKQERRFPGATAPHKVPRPAPARKPLLPHNGRRAASLEGAGGGNAARICGRSSASAWRASSAKPASSAPQSRQSWRSASLSSGGAGVRGREGRARSAAMVRCSLVETFIIEIPRILAISK